MTLLEQNLAWTQALLLEFEIFVHDESTAAGQNQVINHLHEPQGLLQLLRKRQVDYPGV